MTCSFSFCSLLRLCKHSIRKQIFFETTTSDFDCVMTHCFKYRSCWWLFSVYDITGATSDRNCVVLNDIHIDIMDYIVPASCTDTEFRQMWAEFEWENKVTVNTNITDLSEYLVHVMSCTNMKCLTPEKVSSQSGCRGNNAWNGICSQLLVTTSCSTVHGPFRLET